MNAWRAGEFMEEIIPDLELNSGQIIIPLNKHHKGSNVLIEYLKDKHAIKVTLLPKDKS